MNIPVRLILICFVFMLLVPSAVAQGQWILSAVVENIDPGIEGDQYQCSISGTVGKIQIAKEHKGTKGYDPYIQTGIMTWDSLPTAMHPGEKLEIALYVADGGSTPGYRNTGILSFSKVGERDYEFIASKYRGLDQTISYTMPQGVEGEELQLMIKGSMGTKEIPSAQYFYTYTFHKTAVQTIPVSGASGKVTLNTRGVVVPVTSGTLLKPGDVVVSGMDGTASIQGQTYLDTNTAVGIIDGNSMVLFMGRVHVDSTSGLELTLADLIGDPGDEFLIYRLKSSMDEISARDDINAITNTGSEFTVSMTDSDADIAVLRGTVVFDKNGDKVTVPEGQTLHVPDGGESWILLGVPEGEWWITTEEPVEQEGSPALGWGAAVLLLMAAGAIRRA